jgi:hypothetical protein
MGRDSLRVTVLVSCALAGACDTPSVFTDIDLVIPPGDSTALREMNAIEIEVYSPSAAVCGDLQTWALTSCFQMECDEPYQADHTPLARVTLARDGTGFGGADLTVPGDGPWQILARGIDSEGDAFLVGCQVTADAGGRVRVQMFRPWCDPLACASQYHAACEPEVRCEMMLDRTAENPPCGSSDEGEELETWEEDGIACPPAASERFGACQPAVVLCENGRTQPISDGTCPVDDVDELCGGDDLDCDGVRPGPCMAECSEPELAARCGDAECFEVRCTPEDAVECVERALGTRCSAGACCGGACVDTDTNTAHCGGCGRRCDGTCTAGVCGGVVTPPCTVDECNAGRLSSQPRADGCGGADGEDCRCGDGPACTGSTICCDGRCGDACASSVADAGVPCGPELCLPGGADDDCDGLGDDVDSDALADCLRRGILANGCTAAGECTCNGLRPCATGACCRGVGCVDTSNDPRHCGRCFNVCGDGQSCSDGVCL